MANIVRPVMERGIVLSKEFKKATESFKTSDGSLIPAQPDRYVVKVASAYACTKDMGLNNPTIIDYKVEKEVFDKLVYLQEVEVIFELSTSGASKPVSLKILANK